jgi:CBS domain-containing protein
VGLSISYDGNLIDKCDEGDILGLRPFFANYLMDAMAREEFALCYSNCCFKTYVFQNQKFLSFLLESFASNTRNPTTKRMGKLIENVIYNEQDAIIQYFKPISHTENPIT